MSTTKLLRCLNFSCSGKNNVENVNVLLRRSCIRCQMLSAFSVLSCRESADGGRIAVQVEDKVVRVRNVKVSYAFEL